jgi:hypothetical protein
MLDKPHTESVEENIIRDYVKLAPESEWMGCLELWTSAGEGRLAYAGLLASLRGLAGRAG